MCVWAFKDTKSGALDINQMVEVDGEKSKAIDNWPKSNDVSELN